MIETWERLGNETPTLEGINIEALVVPVDPLFVKRALDRASLCVVWGDYPVGFAFVLKALSKQHDRFDLFLVLKVASRRGFSACIVYRINFHIERPQLTNELFPSASSCSEPSTSTNRHATTLEGTTWLGFDLRSPSYTCLDMKSPIWGGMRS